MIPLLREHEAVEAVVQGYIDGVANTDTALLSKVFHPEAVISGTVFPPGGPEEGVFVIGKAIGTLVEYMKSAPPVSKSSPNYRGRITSLEVVDTLATAVVVEEALEGRDFINHFQLQLTEGRWVIVSKALASEPSRKRE